uniref:L-aspartate oxidase n=1 Tax=Candidatus Kentrum sp. FM TaxID=2126340 RepID=A0A450SHJ4_9GAMM|nr:MAG: L-aspartate oxidase [Candidatus Kentron sp. FM]VFJ52631.1 MAG: L-aspartate oxidase [Candidatus Kentron sp. FM]VFK09369.1 MAG: L-aspartate oxidase [Candidatus Kentron sp. FM]
MNQQHCSDVLIIGSGAAGLSAALYLAPYCKVSVLSKTTLTEGNTLYAQGGVSVVLHEEDSIDSHVDDTLQAGAGLCDPDIVRFVVEQGRICIRALIELGVDFTTTRNTGDTLRYHLTREGGHSHRRVIHAADATGRAIEDTLVAKVRAHPNISLFESHLALDVITGEKLGIDANRPDNNRCYGAYVFDRKEQCVKPFSARAVVLATGGAGKVYRYTSNPDVATGDGIAMAWRAGCRIANMEFVQFHPTCLYHPLATSFLITEAIRGEGGKLVSPDGAHFMERFDPRGELAPRDIVARAIDHEMKRLGAECVYLDITAKRPAFIQSHFPTVYARCKELGYDITRAPIPVVPAAHYTCGGIVTDRWGRTDLHGLYAVGEVAWTGLHGANRMASNSLLECLVFAKSASEHIKDTMKGPTVPVTLREWDESRVTDSDEEVVVSHNWGELRRFMWNYVGIVRSTKRLQRAKRRVDLLQSEIAEYYRNFRVTGNLIELRNLVVCADLIIRCALTRKESRGLHYCLDYPQVDESRSPANTVLVPENWVRRDVSVDFLHREV